MSKRIQSAETNQSYMSPDDVARELKISRKTVDRLCRSGQIRSSKLHPARNGKRIIKRAEIERFIADCEV